MDCEYIEEFSKHGFTTDENLRLLAVSHGIKQAHPWKGFKREETVV